METIVREKKTDGHAMFLRTYIRLLFTSISWPADTWNGIHGWAIELPPYQFARILCCAGGVNVGCAPTTKVILIYHGDSADNILVGVIMIPTPSITFYVNTSWFVFGHDSSVDGRYVQK